MDFTRPQISHSVQRKLQDCHEVMKSEESFVHFLSFRAVALFIILHSSTFDSNRSQNTRAHTRHNTNTKHHFLFVRPLS
jgi:hypothetical protein